MGTKNLKEFMEELQDMGGKEVRHEIQTGQIVDEVSVYVPGSINSHYFHTIGDGKNQPNSAGVYIPIIRIPIKGGMTIPNIATFDHGTYRAQ